jgi:uncharacterized protein YcbX
VYNKTKPGDEISVPLSTSGLELNEALVWDDRVFVKSYGNQINEWFSDQLQMDCRLVYMPDETHRLVDQRFSINKDITSLSDGYPFLIIGQESLNLLNSKLEITLPMNRFRPNLVFTGGMPHDEDNWEKFSINGIVFRPVKPCARCVITTVNQDTGEQGTEPLKTLATYRGAENNKVLFGMNLLHEGSGFINVGDDIIF